ncbi:MAG: acylphosphatase [Gammaproteobacteria bacterium]|nr:acylphosphatase [Gammaproteobacteria bacterium]
MKALRFHITGNVQGVGFRWWTKQQAAALGLCGWARNLADGSVEVTAAGTKAALGELQARLRHGPAAATVTKVRAAAAEAAPPGPGFDIR